MLIVKIPPPQLKLINKSVINSASGEPEQAVFPIHIFTVVPLITSLFQEPPPPVSVKTPFTIAVTNRLLVPDVIKQGHTETPDTAIESVDFEFKIPQGSQHSGQGPIQSSALMRGMARRY